MSKNIEMDKENVAHLCNGILLSRNKEKNIVPLAEMWMDLETDVHKSEVRERKTNLY